MKPEKIETHYRIELKASEYDFLEIVQDNDKRITIKFLDTRWREVPETIAMLKEIIDALKLLK